MITVDLLIAELQELKRRSVVGPNTPVRLDAGASGAVPLRKIEHEIQLSGPPYLKLS